MEQSRARKAEEDQLRQWGGWGFKEDTDQKCPLKWPRRIHRPGSQGQAGGRVQEAGSTDCALGVRWRRGGVGRGSGESSVGGQGDRCNLGLSMPAGEAADSGRGCWSR